MAMRDTRIKITLTRTSEVDWQPLVEHGVDTTGIYVKTLRFDEDGRPPSFLLRFDPGASYPNHDHPGGEELFVLSGEARVGGAHLRAGDYLYTPARQRHAVATESGCELLFIVPQEVEILR